MHRLGAWIYRVDGAVEITCQQVVKHFAAHCSPLSRSTYDGNRLGLKEVSESIRRGHLFTSIELGLHAKQLETDRESR